LPDSDALQRVLWKHLAAADFEELFRDAESDWRQRCLRDLDELQRRSDMSPEIRIPPGTVAVLEAEIELQIQPWADPCTLCLPLARPQAANRHDGESLPGAVRRLAFPSDLRRSAFEVEQLLSSRSWSLRCPVCGRFYDFIYYYEYGPGGGTIDTEDIAPASVSEARLLARAWVLDEFPPG